LKQAIKVVAIVMSMFSHKFGVRILCCQCFKKERQTFYTVTLVTEVILVAQCLFVKHLLMSALGKLWT